MDVDDRDTNLTFTTGDPEPTSDGDRAALLPDTCAHCASRPPAYPGAIYCGAACAALAGA